MSNFQELVDDVLWPVFAEDATDLPERVARFFEEAAELAQACYMSFEDMQKIIAYTCSRPRGAVRKEIGDVMFSLAALCELRGDDMDICAEQALDRMRQPGAIEKMKQKRSTRHGRGPLPGVVKE